MMNFFMRAASLGILPGYDYRRSIAIENTGNPEALDGDQVLISLTSSNFIFAHAMINGEDIRFTSSDGRTLLPHWIASYSLGGQTAKIWVKVSGVLAGQIGTIYLYYGAAGSSTASSFATAMERFSTSETNAQYVVRFNDGSGTTPANIGSAGGTMAINGGSTWNATDLWGGNTGGLTLNGTSGYISKTGLLDAYSAEGHLYINFNFVSFSGTPRIFSKSNRNANTGSDFGDFFNLHVRAADRKLGFSVYKGATQQRDLSGNVVLTTGTNYAVSVVWNAARINVYLTPENGTTTLEISVPNSSAVVTMPPNGSGAAFFIGANHTTGTGVATAFANMKVNDFAYQSYQPYLKDICALHNKTTRVQKDEITKWEISRTATLGAAEPASVIEPDLTWDGNQWVLYYVLYGSAKSPTHELYRRTAPSIDPNTSISWSAATKVLGGGASGIAGAVNNPHVRKFGSTWYAYFRNGTGAGPISVATSTDGITFNTPTIALANSGVGFGSSGYFNSDVILDPSDGLYKMLVEASDPSVTYSIGLATCATPGGTFVLSGGNPKTTMLYGGGTGNYGGPAIQFVGSTIHCWLHQKETAGLLPMDLYRVYSTDFNTWVKPTNYPIINRERSWEFDQASDTSRPVEVNGVTYMIYGGLKNSGTFEGYINVAKFSGTLNQLVTNLSLTVGNEQAL